MNNTRIPGEYKVTGGLLGIRGWLQKCTVAGVFGGLGRREDEDEVSTTSLLRTGSVQDSLPKINIPIYNESKGG